MTKHGKCDVCRKRKIKCDAVWPSCASCEKSHQSCTYAVGLKKASKTARFIHIQPLGMNEQHENSLYGGQSSPSNNAAAVLRLRKSAHASIGDGLFHQFAFRAIGNDDKGCEKDVTPETETELLVRETRLGGRTTKLITCWKSACEAIAPGEREPYAVGEWLEDIPRRIGHNPTVDAALECFISSVIAFDNQNMQNIPKALKSTSKALAGIRSILKSGDSETIQDHALLAISLLGVAEVLKGIEAFAYKVHMRGRLELLIEVTDNGASCTETSKQMFFSSALTDMMPSIFKGRDSLFDTPTWLAIPAPTFLKPEYPWAERVEEYLIRLSVRVPRLVRLVRTARQKPGNVKALSEAASFAETLYLDGLEDWILMIMEMKLIWLVPTTQATYNPPTDTSFHFISMRLFKRCVHYWHLRCVLSGCVLALLHIASATTCPAALVNLNSTVIGHEKHAAECIIMSVQWAASYSSILPLSDLRMVEPLTNAFGVFYRLEQRTDDIIEAQNSRKLQQWIADTTTAIGHNLSAPAVKLETLQGMHEILMGGALPGR